MPQSVSGNADRAHNLNYGQLMEISWKTTEYPNAIGSHADGKELNS